VEHADAPHWTLCRGMRLAVFRVVSLHRANGEQKSAPRFGPPIEARIPRADLRRFS
jgi:hypothetical protein